MTHAPRLAIGQIAMHWAMADNVAAMRQAMRRARAAEAELIAFPELALTGFHRRIAEWAKPELVAPALAQVQDEAATLGLAVVLGAPTFTAEGRPMNSEVFIGADGALLGSVDKSGLTAPEATFFAPGTQRPTLSLAGRRCSALLCRECEDAEHLLPHWAAQPSGASPELLLWPGIMRPDPDGPADRDPPRHVVQAQAIAKACQAFVVQANWPNALNYPEESAHSGHSACIAPDGELLFRLPKAEAGIGVFALGDRHFDWLAE